VQIRANDAARPSRGSLDLGGDQYAMTPSAPPCDELSAEKDSMARSFADDE
jgi:hypothetical protein